MNLKKNLLGVLIVIIGSVIAAQAATLDQPYMEAARAELQKARAELQAALRNKGGHRGKAVILVNQALGEVNAGIAYARGHNHASMPDQPHMKAALDALKSAKNDLNQATPDKGGHRAKAIDLVNAAIDEVQKGIQAGEGG